MDNNLVGYLLNALDPDTQREVEGYLRSHPEAQERLELIRRALQPLAADRDTIEPPSGLRARTLARVGEYRCRQLRPVPQAPPVRQTAPGRSWWRRADALVAASLLLLLVPLTWRVLATLHHQRNIVSCQNNLRMFHAALVAYSDYQPDHALPKVEENPPFNIAGIFVPILYQADCLPSDVSVTCPENGFRSPEPVSLQTLAAEQATQPEQFERDAYHLAGCYAYCLGFRDAQGRHCGLRCDPTQPNNNYIPIMADRPPFEQREFPKVLSGNSLNHGSEGQNVLFLGGHVEFFKSRNVGIDGDDIYLNRNKRIEAGLDRYDAVLGASGFRPYP